MKPLLEQIELDMTPVNLREWCAEHNFPEDIMVEFSKQCIDLGRLAEMLGVPRGEIVMQMQKYIFLGRDSHRVRQTRRVA